MQKELILVLLGIIGTSFLSSFLSGYPQTESDKVLLDTVVGIVGSGNFSYWQLGHSGPLLIELTSLYGDADIYVSDNNKPSYEVDRNNFSSTTCGKDVVNIPSDFPRPIGLGVFGHWSHALSEYTIKVYLDAPAAIEERMSLAATGDISGDADMKKTREKSPRKQDEENRPRFLKLLSILDMIFEMFVL